MWGHPLYIEPLPGSFFATASTINFTSGTDEPKRSSRFFYFISQKNASMVLFVDMDEVLADTYGAHIEIYNSDYEECLTSGECMGMEVWQMVPEERQESVRNHARNIGFFRHLKPIPHSQEVLKRLSGRYDVYIASAAMQFPNSLEEKSDWLDEHFPFIPWQNRILCGHKHILKGDILIDDRRYNLEAFNGRALLFTSPHNVHTNGFERVDNWHEVAEKLL